MRYQLALAALLLPLSGCVVPPPEGPAMYPQPGYAAAYPLSGYPSAYPQSDYSYPGYAYNNGSPYYMEGGASYPLIFYGGGWGYWDGYHRWRRAPDAVWHDLDRRHPGGYGYRPWAGEPGGFRREGFRPEGFRPEGFRREGFRPEGGRPEGFHPEGGRPEGPRAGGNPAGGGQPGGGRPGGVAAVVGAFRGQPPAQGAPAPAGGQAKQNPERHRPDEHR